MADTESQDEVALAPPVAPLLERASAAWFAPLRDRLAALRSQGRMPHGLLLAGIRGAGQAEVGVWLAASVLCRGPAVGACGRCGDCRLFLAGNHPDFHWVSVLPDKKEISIEQMRRLSRALALRSYRGGAKVAVITPAEAMNAKAFNALLKTLEEPPAQTYLLLAANRIDRVPKTVLSRCMRLRLPVPEEHEAIAWLERGRKDPGWPVLLALAGGAPFLAAEYAESGLAGLDAEMQGAIEAALDGQLDIVGFAEVCARNSPAARLVWLESWLTRRLKDAALGSDLGSTYRLPCLRPPGAETKIRAAYGLLDQLREARLQLGGPLNALLLFEQLAVSLADLVGRPAPKAGKSSG
ncbi:MAG: DNA polymerase III subunit delta' [Gammaproteobacteria bacterium]|nr:DNA polymerase III subunit delta' [Gammaproteobacteria bacterium]